jgi:hypothetical protein
MGVEKSRERDYEPAPRVNAWFLAALDRPIQSSPPGPDKTDFPPRIVSAIIHKCNDFAGLRDRKSK